MGLQANRNPRAMQMTKVHAIVTAAGSGRRFDADISKQYLELGDRPVLVHSLARLAENHSLAFEHTSPEKYFKELHASGTQWPVQKNEFGYHPGQSGWKGCYSSHARIKKYNRYYENRLLAAEKFSAIGTFYKGKPFYPREDFLAAWKILLFNQFHDILPGTLTGLGRLT